ncbi:hypothetical protein [Vibrio sp. ED002]|uniref:hypothetical protein n=1 Tax=Vibrio sp. ED002 TaxID=2785123 RepID=UPI00200FAC54|nr:hypothetical protein [Vibrio sp. ED002]UQA50913.1 hypothetical protein ITG12_00740 [Vibrio sp. ED002]
MTKESKTKVKLKSELIKKLPFFPDDRDTLNELNGQTLSEVFLHYLHWQTRQVPRRCRKVTISPELTSDKRYKDFKIEISALLKKVREGDDLSPFLSLRAHKKGYTPVKRITSGEVDSWEDKDQILNTKGFHHFHLNMKVQKSGISQRTDVVLFAKVERNKFHAVALFDHSVFDSSNELGKMPIERERMWNIHTKYESYGLEPGAVFYSHPIMSSGHPMYIVRMADYYTQVIEVIDPQLSERSLANDYYGQGKMKYPEKFKFVWHFDGLDLTVHDTKNNVNFLLVKGPI